MTVYLHELRRGRRALLLWTAAIACFMAMCLFLFPEMKSQMAMAGKLFASMGAFTAAFGMNKLDFGTLTGFYAIECGNILGLGGAFYAASTAAGLLANEEKEHTAEFLLTHPVSRGNVLCGKLAALLTELVILNVLITLVSVGCIAAIGEPIPWRAIGLMHTAFFACQIELALFCFTFSAFSRGSGIGAALGLTLAAYCMNLLANLSSKLSVLKTVSPFGYTDAADLLTKNVPALLPMLLGLAAGAACAAFGCIHYIKKDIRC